MFISDFTCLLNLQVADLLLVSKKSSTFTRKVFTNRQNRTVPAFNTNTCDKFTREERVAATAAVILMALEWNASEHVKCVDTGLNSVRGGYNSTKGLAN